MDDYENIFNGAGSAPTAAGGAASLGPDAAGYAPTAAATPTPTQGNAGQDANPVDALAPLARQQAATALSLGASALSPTNWAQTATANGVFAQGAAQPPTDLLAQLKQEALQAVLDRRGGGTAQNGAVPNGSIKTLVEGLLNARGGNPATEGMTQQAVPAPNAPSAQPAPEPPLPQFTPARGSDGRERNGYDYNGVRVELPVGFDTSDPAKTAAQVSFSNQMVDWMTNDDDEMEV